MFTAVHACRQAVAYLFLVRSMRRLLLGITLSVVAVACAACLRFMWTADSHHLNLRYVMWKHHAWRFEPEFMLKYLTSDGDFTISLEGKTKEEIQRFFPVLTPPDRALTDYQK